eukprot:531609-Pyramimonas_sp.AAC.1
MAMVTVAGSQRQISPSILSLTGGPEGADEGPPLEEIGCLSAACSVGLLLDSAISRVASPASCGSHWGEDGPLLTKAA